MRAFAILASERARGAGVTGLPVYCADYHCSHLRRLSEPEDGAWSDSVRLSDLQPRFVCTRCGNRGADVRPDFSPAPMGTPAR
jgi:hypothetical protein